MRRERRRRASRPRRSTRRRPNAATPRRRRFRATRPTPIAWPAILRAGPCESRPTIFRRRCSQQFAPLPPMSDSDTIEPPGALDRATDDCHSDEALSTHREQRQRRLGGRRRLRATAARSPASTGGRSGGGEGGSGSPAVSLTGIARGDGDVGKPVPDAYRLRVAPNRANVAQSRGGTAETEAAVKAALKWLADNQAADGRWNPRTHGAGKETNVLGRDRQNAGSHADTAMTGLALLAFLASGHTHLDGPYRDDVRRGLEYLMRTQAADGNLAGQAAPFEFMYCHAMAACALSEAYGMTHDARLREPVRRAVGYTLRAQDPVGGGWRYKPGDAGDTSQLGWQLMTLKSAELAGIPIPDSTRQGIIRYLQSVSSGKYGGRASYRPGEQATPNHDRRGAGLLAVPRPVAAKSGLQRGGRLPAGRIARRRRTRICTIGTTRRWACTSCRASTGSGGTTPCARRWSAAR